jgi:(2S)-methylsuccinyl-CoA dehydrogenase
MEGRAIDTIGYRGMHSYEVAFDNWYVPGENLIGGESGQGRGFGLQMQGFENGRLQTAARAVGLMQAAYEAAYDYATNRKLFGQPLLDYQLTQTKLARMAIIIQASRQFAYRVARLMATAPGRTEATRWSRPTSALRLSGSHARPCRSTAGWGTPKNSP